MPRRLLAIALAVAATASVLVATALAEPPDPPTQGNVDTTGPALDGVPGDMTVTAGQTVTYATPTANDLVDGARPVSCAPESGFTAATTVTVSCSASDLSGNVSSADFLVTVAAPPNTPPTLILPGNVTTEATGPTTSVSFTASASDAEDDPDPTPTCDPASGSPFPVGTTTVGCSVTDGGSASASGSSR